MHILEGGFPEGQAWRALILLSIGETPNAAWKLAHMLVKGHSGELVLASVLPDNNKGDVSQIRQTQNHAKAYFGDDIPIYSLIIESSDKRRTLRDVVEQGILIFYWLGLTVLPGQD